MTTIRVAPLALVALLAAAAPLPRADLRPSLVLVSIDTLRADHLGAYGYPRATSPFIDSLARDGLVFEDVLVPLPATSPSHASLLTALHPVRHGLLMNSMHLPPQAETLAEALRAAGYATLGTTSVSHLSRTYGFDQGFAVFDGLEHEGERTAADTMAVLWRMLEEYARLEPRPPLFLFVHLFDPHFPYVTRDRVEGPLPAGRESWWNEIDAYDSEIAFADRQLRRLYRRLRALGLSDRVVSCVTSDHGEQLGEHGLVALHADIYTETVRVPLVLHGPGVGRGRIRRLVSSLDIAPSLLALAGARFRGPVDGSGGLLAGDGTAPGPDLLVVGYPSYTRSVAVYDPGWASLWNLDPHYESVLVGPLGDARAARLAEEGYREIAVARRDGEGAAYTVESPGLEPSFVQAVVEPAPQRCAATVVLRLEPRLFYLDTPLQVGGGLRLLYPVSFLDRTAIVASPARCVGRVYARVVPGQRTQETRSTGVRRRTFLFEKLYPERKAGGSDELYDRHADPGMTRNLSGRPERGARGADMHRRIRGLVERLLGRGRLPVEEGRDYSPNELELLRSLGYVR